MSHFFDVVVSRALDIDICGLAWSTLREPKFNSEPFVPKEEEESYNGAYGDES